MNKILLASVLAVTTASAQMTGDWGRAAYSGGMMGGYGGGSVAFGLLTILLYLGLILLVWLWVIKLWKEIRRMK